MCRNRVFNRASLCVALALMALLGASAHAEVLDAAPNAFTVRTTATVGKPPDVVYDALTREVGLWWDRAHTFSGLASNLSLDARPGGCFCERLPGGGVEHMVVLYADRGKMLRMRGGLGPLQAMAVTGVWTLTLTERDGQTTVESTYAVSGYSKEGLAALAPVVDRVLGEQLARFAQHVGR